jgi:hypothetical protein
MVIVHRRERVYAIGTVPTSGLVVPIAAKQPEKAQNWTPVVRPNNIALAALYACPRIAVSSGIKILLLSISIHSSMNLLARAD